MTERKMFDPPRYATRGIVESLAPDIQFTLWAMVDVLRLRSGVEPDYLQVFDLAPSEKTLAPFNQAIQHRQEEPRYSATNYLCVDDPITVRVFIIDDGSHSTMLLAEEY